MVSIALLKFQSLINATEQDDESPTRSDRNVTSPLNHFEDELWTKRWYVTGLEQSDEIYQEMTGTDDGRGQPLLETDSGKTDPPSRPHEITKSKSPAGHNGCGLW
jgi:hypothetical protein